MSHDLLITKRNGSVTTITLNRPDALNALSLELERALIHAIERAGSDAEIRAIVLTGAGRAFCAGVDLKELELSGTEARNWLGPGSLVYAMRSCPTPIVAAVNGFAITGGLELALLSDFIIASDGARFADTHARVGITPSWGCTQVLPRRIGIARARQMSLTGAFIDAQRAYDWGLANEVVPADNLLSRAEQLAHEIAGTDPVSAGRIRGLIERSEETSLSAGLEDEAAVFQTHIKTLTPEKTAANREKVQRSGRAQTRSE